MRLLCFANVARMALGMACLLLIPVQSRAAQEDAAPFSYEVVIDAPPAIAKLLRDNLAIVRLRQNPRMNVARLEALLADSPAQVRRLTATDGFFTPSVQVRLEQNDGRRVAHLHVEPGEPVKVVDVDLQFSGEMASESNARLDALRLAWALKPGMVFRQADWERAKRELLFEVMAERFAGANFTLTQADVDPVAATAALRVGVESGPAYTLGALEIEGLSRYPESLIRDLNPARVGAPYSRAALAAFQSRLLASGHFATAIVTAPVANAQGRTLPVVAKVSETATQTLGLGAGYSTNTGARGQIDYQFRNLFNRGWRLESGLKLEQRAQSADLDFLRPLDDRGYKDRLRVAFERADLQGEVVRKFILGGNRAWESASHTHAVSLTFNHEQQDIAGEARRANRALVANYALGRQALDDPLSPRQGYLWQLQVGGAARALLSDRSFTRAQGKGMHFFPLGEHASFILRGELGVVGADTRLGVPSDFLFRTGGDQSVRGYAYQSLGVKEGSAVVGGRYIGVASAEYAYYFNEHWGSALFYDTGAAADTLTELGHLNAGYGIGLRWRSPVGALNFDIAYGEEVEKYRVHFSVGVVF